MKSTIHHLEMTSLEMFRPSEISEGFELKKVSDGKISERFYREVGAAWQWTDRLVWTDEQWADWTARPETETWVASFQGEEAGYFELEKQEDGNTEIVYFGLLSGMIGRGLGSALLTATIRQGWAIEGTRRVWVHTCTEDHAHALSNYEKRGFRLFQTEVV